MRCPQLAAATRWWSLQRSPRLKCAPGYDPPAVREAPSAAALVSRIERREGEREREPAGQPTGERRRDHAGHERGGQDDEQRFTADGAGWRGMPVADDGCELLRMRRSRLAGARSQNPDLHRPAPRSTLSKREQGVEDLAVVAATAVQDSLGSLGRPCGHADGAVESLVVVAWPLREPLVGAQHAHGGPAPPFAGPVDGDLLRVHSHSRIRQW